jgi:CBS-domain-containing membrane protein
MEVKDIMTKQVTTCSPDDTLAHAASLLWESDCGLLPVCDNDGIHRLVGVITDRDICMSALFQGKPLQALKVSDAMARVLHVCQRGDTLADVEIQLRQSQLRRLPVIDHDGALTGIITLADLAREAARERGRAGTRHVSESQVGDTLAKISEPMNARLAN